MSNAFASRALSSLARSLQSSRGANGPTQRRCFLHGASNNAWSFQRLRPAKVDTSRPTYPSTIAVQGIRLKSKSTKKASPPHPTISRDSESSTSASAHDPPALHPSLPNESPPNDAQGDAETVPEGSQDETFQYTWKDYDETTGMPLPEGPLKESEIIRLFGTDVTYEEGNHALQILQWRRESGALADQGVSFPDGPELSQNLALIALEFLREKYPRDEEEAAIAWAELEVARLEEDMYEKGANWGIFKKDPTAVLDPSKVETKGFQGTEYGQKRYGYSVLEEMQREAKAREQEEREAEVAKGNPPLTKAEREHEQKELQLVEKREQLGIQRAERRQRMEKEAYVSDKSPEELAKTPFIERVWSSAMVTIGAVLACFLYAAYYVPPSSSARMFPEIPPALTTIAAIVAINLLVNRLWTIPQFWKIFNKAMVVVPISPRAFGVIGNVFSHQDFKHLAFNMVGVALIGPTLHEQVGRGEFISIFTASGVASSFLMLAYLVGTRQWNTYLLGASGAIYGILSALCVIRPTDTLHVPLPYLNEYDLPFSSTALIAILLSIEALLFWTVKTSNATHLTHIIGAMWGAGHGYAVKARYKAGPDTTADPGMMEEKQNSVTAKE